MFIQACWFLWSQVSRDELDWSTNELRNCLRAIDWDLEDLSETISILLNRTKSLSIILTTHIFTWPSVFLQQTDALCHSLTLSFLYLLHFLFINLLKTRTIFTYTISKDQKYKKTLSVVRKMSENVVFNRAESSGRGGNTTCFHLMVELLIGLWLVTVLIVYYVRGC